MRIVLIFGIIIVAFALLLPLPASAGYRVIGKAEMKSLRAAAAENPADAYLIAEEPAGLYDCRYRLYLLDDNTGKEIKVSVPREIWERFEIGDRLKEMVVTADSGQE